jgi:hypothetical protein
MEYESANRWRNSEKTSTSTGLLYDVRLGLCKHVRFAPKKMLKDSDVPPSIEEMLHGITKEVPNKM